jgi:hypothetical protein
MASAATRGLAATDGIGFMQDDRAPPSAERTDETLPGILVERINDFCSSQRHARPTFIGRSYGTAALEIDHASH